MSELSKEVKDLLAATKRTYPKMNYVAVDKYEEVELYERKPILSGRGDYYCCTDGSETVSISGGSLFAIRLKDEITFEMGPVYFGDFEI